jgi:myosin heavy subunit
METETPSKESSTLNLPDSPTRKAVKCDSIVGCKESIERVVSLIDSRLFELRFIVDAVSDAARELVKTKLQKKKFDQNLEKFLEEKLVRDETRKKDIDAAKSALDTIKTLEKTWREDIRKHEENIAEQHPQLSRADSSIAKFEDVIKQLENLFSEAEKRRGKLEEYSKMLAMDQKTAFGEKAPYESRRSEINQYVGSNYWELAEEAKALGVRVPLHKTPTPRKVSERIYYSPPRTTPLSSRIVPRIVTPRQESKTTLPSVTNLQGTTNQRLGFFQNLANDIRTTLAIKMDDLKIFVERYKMYTKSIEVSTEAISETKNNLLGLRLKRGVVQNKLDALEKPLIPRRSAEEVGKKRAEDNLIQKQEIYDGAVYRMKFYEPGDADVKDSLYYYIKILAIVKARVTQFIANDTKDMCLGLGHDLLSIANIHEYHENGIDARLVETITQGRELIRHQNDVNQMCSHIVKDERFVFYFSV